MDMGKKNYCSECGYSIPDGQRTCSMCYGDIVEIKLNYKRRVNYGYN